MTDPIVFVPGVLCTEEVFSPQIKALSGRADNMVVDHTRHDSIRAIAESALAAAPERFSLVGLSMGGYIALEMVAQAGDRIASLVLIDTNAAPDRPEQTAVRRALMDLARREGVDAVIDQLLPIFVDEARLGDTELVAIVRKMANETGVEVFIRQQEAIIARKDARPNLGKITAPTLVIVGDRDRLTPPEQSEEIAAGIPNARLEKIGESGHLTTLERPDAVTALLVDFLIWNVREDDGAVARA